MRHIIIQPFLFFAAAFLTVSPAQAFGESVNLGKIQKGKWNAAILFNFKKEGFLVKIDNPADKVKIDNPADKHTNQKSFSFQNVHRVCQSFGYDAAMIFPASDHAILMFNIEGGNYVEGNDKTLNWVICVMNNQQ